MRERYSIPKAYNGKHNHDNTVDFADLKQCVFVKHSG